MRSVEELKEHAHNLKNEVTALYYAYQHPDLKLIPKLLLLFTLGYVLSPIDLIPDFIPGDGKPPSYKTEEKLVFVYGFITI